MQKLHVVSLIAAIAGRQLGKGLGSAIREVPENVEDTHAFRVRNYIDMGHAFYRPSASTRNRRKRIAKRGVINGARRSQ
jgi:hypothetical protein